MNNKERYLAEIMKSNNSMKKTVVVDLDGTITDFLKCTIGCDYSGYPETASSLQRLLCPVREGIQSFLSDLQNQGFKIIIQTSRVESEKYETICWLQENDIPYNEIYFGKPRGFIYIDDLAHEFTSIANAKSEIERRQKQ